MRRQHEPGPLFRGRNRLSMATGRLFPPPSTPYCCIRGSTASRPKSSRSSVRLQPATQHFFYVTAGSHRGVPTPTGRRAGLACIQPRNLLWFEMQDPPPSRPVLVNVPPRVRRRMEGLVTLPAPPFRYWDLFLNCGPKYGSAAFIPSRMSIEMGSIAAAASPYISAFARIDSSIISSSFRSLNATMT